MGEENTLDETPGRSNCMRGAPDDFSKDIEEMYVLVSLEGENFLFCGQNAR